MTPNGASANSNGNQLELLLSSLIVQNNYKQCASKDFLTLCQHSSEKLFASQVFIGATIYNGKKRRCDVALFNPLWKNKYHQGILIIECKWQQSSGSVDEKFPYLVLNINHLPYHTLVLLDGGAYSAGAEQWLRSQIGEKLIDVFNMSQLIKASNNRFFD